jgi:hypothetical protein
MTHEESTTKGSSSYGAYSAWGTRAPVMPESLHFEATNASAIPPLAAVTNAPRHAYRELSHVYRCRPTVPNPRPLPIDAWHVRSGIHPPARLRPTGR